MNANLISPSFSLDLLDEMAQLRRSARRRAQGHDDLADDLVQETLIRAWAHRDRFAQGTNMGAWLHTILRNTHISHIRKSSREQIGLAEGWEDRLTTPATQIDHLALVEVAAAMKLLPEDDRGILIALGVEGRAHEDIALETRLCDGHRPQPPVARAPAPARHPGGRHRRVCACPRGSGPPAWPGDAGTTFDPGRVARPGPPVL